MNQIFLEELKMYLADHPIGEKIERLPIRADKRFHDNVEPGDLRLFADVFPPRSGLFYKRHPSGLWIVIPLSDRSFTVPASNEEALVGERVYQFWNELALPDRYAVRSYFMAHLPNVEMSAIGAVLCHLRVGEPMPKGLQVAFGGPITKPDDPRLEYFKAFRLRLSDFTPALNFRVCRIQVPAKVVERLPKLKTAADVYSDSPVFVVCRKGAPGKRGTFSDDYRTCRLAIPFERFGAGLEPKVLTFKGLSDLPGEWNIVDGAFVSIHEKKSRKQIGFGRFDLGGNKIVIDDFSGLETLSNPIESTSDIVLVVTTKPGDK